MKKRVLTILLTLGLLISTLVVPAGAAGVAKFSDVTDPITATAIETLRLMGVLDGYGDGTFRPAGHLTRAQFCKMAAYVMDGETELAKYRTVTIFPDVKPSHWAAGYINLSAKGKGIITGYADGKFYPERTVTVGHAVTILLRLLGYKEEVIGGVWPDSYMAAGAAIGLTDGVGTAGNAPLTRAQAAKLFLNLLDTEKSGGGTLYTLSKETQLYSVDGSTGEMKTSAGVYKMVHPVSTTSLAGAKGYVVLNEDGKALTFLPVTSGSGSISNAAVIVAADRSSAGFSDLSGSAGYALYKNGIPINLNDLRKNDVATYHPDTNAIRVCDTRVSVYYESCEPNPDAPSTIKVLGGTEFNVLPTAVQSLSKFKPGRQITLLLTADGQVAAAAEGNTSGQGNALGIVSDDGSIQLLCGTTRIPLAATADEAYCGKVVRISSFKKDTVNLAVLNGGVSGDLDVAAKKLGGRDLTENVMIYENGQQISVSQITSGIVNATQISAARTNWAGDVDLVVLGNGSTGNVIYGKAIVRELSDSESLDDESKTTVEVVYGGKTTGAIVTAYAVNDGEYVAATMEDGRFTQISSLTELKGVSNSSWIGTGSVLFGGRNYTVSRNILCYNLDSREWITLEQAHAYASKANLYVKDGVVHIIEVAHN